MRGYPIILLAACGWPSLHEHEHEPDHEIIEVPALDFCREAYSAECLADFCGEEITSECVDAFCGGDPPECADLRELIEPPTRTP